jgi:hypothetical protein
MSRNQPPDPPQDLLSKEIVASFHFDRRMPVAGLLRVFELVGMDPATARASETVGGPRRNIVMEGRTAIELLLTGDGDAFGFSPESGRDDVPDVSIGPWRDGGVLGLMIRNRRWNREIFSMLRTSFDSIVEELDPYRGIMGFEVMVSVAHRMIGSPKGLFDRMPVNRYDWYQAYSPGDFIDTSVKGADIAILGNCVRVASGPTPIAPLAARDTVRAAMLAGLPYDAETIPYDPELVPPWHKAGLLAAADGGTELTDDLRTLTGDGW